MYPKGFHPIIKDLEPSGKKIARPRRRRDVQGIKYYFIDFGISTRFEDDVKQEDRIVTGSDGQDQDVPELDDRVPYNPFAVDIFTLGNVFRKQLIDVSGSVLYPLPD